MSYVSIHFILYDYSDDDYSRIKSINCHHIIISKEVVDSVPIISGYIKLKKQALNSITKINPNLIYEILKDTCSLDIYKKNNYEEYKKPAMIDLRVFDYYK
ncbi:hypothetical protein CNPV088 [Canarypox virus]|uniref:Uncharacterized protein CNPV088 n=1 Tax=Canarypox virus TaxID=44088 RepID=Q6VZQ9_CNPV|nr:hypothetical protein CNPV088 [Canarypox virus]AAR83434.1 CNPV088 conserved hypothetical protein [Canarypox virus]AWD84564.1 hypothetical protein CNPV088 [Canarypox virus]